MPIRGPIATAKRIGQSGAMKGSPSRSDIASHSAALNSKKSLAARMARLV
jgi:hypothetical protein